MKNSFKLNDIDDVIFISDIHFGARSASFEWSENIIQYFNNFFFPLIDSEINEGFKPIVFIAGDFFDNRQHIDIDIMNKALDIVEKMSLLCKVFMITGNHDIYKKKDTDITSLRIFEKFKNVTVIREMSTLTVKNGKSFLVVPWVGDFSQENKIIGKYKNMYDYIIMHTEISGMSYDNGRPIVNGLNVSAIDGGCKIISGHIHKRQSNEKAMYLGSPYHMTKSDIGNDKGIYCFRFTDDNTEVKFTQNDYSPKFLEYRFSDYGRNAENWADIVRNNYVYIVFEESELNKFNVNKFADELQKYLPRKIEFSCIKEKTCKEDVVYSEDVTIEDIFLDQVSNKELNESQNKEIVNMNKSYIKKALEEMNQ